MNAIADNPLFGHDRLPAFDRVTPEHVDPAIRALLPKMASDLAELEKTIQPTWTGSIPRLTALGEALGYAWSVINHLMGVRNSPELRAAHQAVQQDVVTAFMSLGQSAPIYRALVALRDGAEWARLDETQRRIVTANIRAAEHSGVGLTGAARERFQAIELELADLSTRFSNHLLDATKAFALELTDPADVAGLTDTAKLMAAHAAARAAKTEPTADAATRGPWRITLDGPSFMPFMEHATRRDLREKLYRGFVTRASTGEQDNQPLIDRILALRKEKAALLGFTSFAELSLAAKMAPSVASVEKLLGELRTAALPKARVELDELTTFARQRSGDAALTLTHWDIAFWAERMREERYAFTDEELRPYFALPRVLDGLFATAKRLFGVTVRPADGEAPVWNRDVRFFRIADENGRDIAAFYLDPYSRPADKRGGAWMDNALDRKRLSDGSWRLPVAYLVCNQTPPIGEKPSLMTFREVETLFHEFGHGLQHMLTRVDHLEAAGINNVEWDAVELPSQFMENWCYHAPTVLGSAAQPGLARHWQTGEALPRALFDKLTAARTYRAGSMTARQVYMSTLDLELHHRYVPGGQESVIEFQRRIAASGTVIPPLPEDRFLCGFSHIFAGGYAAGYYSYKWAEVLSADAFGAFEDAGLDNPSAVEQTGRRFRDTVLALGGSRHPLEVFRQFRGREPSPKALLRQTGLAS
ncbi:MAG TPA: M3 family metallopeptidase [Planctomycetota bacterium]|nr:M3 family metallopeptidase [Planctomycetota bacterium]